MKRQSPTLLELQMVDLVLQLAERERPSGYRCLLGDKRGLPELQPERIEHALAVAAVVNGIRPAITRRIVLLAMETDRGEPVNDRKAIASRIRVSEATVTRRLRDGLRQVESAMRAASTRKFDRFEHSKNFILTDAPNARSTKAR